MRAAERTAHAALTNRETLHILYHSARASSCCPLTYDGEVLQLPYLLALPLQSPLYQGARTVTGGRRGVHTLSLYRQNRYTPSLLGERCDSLYHPASL